MILKDTDRQNKNKNTKIKALPRNLWSRTRIGLKFVADLDKATY